MLLSATKQIDHILNFVTYGENFFKLLFRTLRVWLLLDGYFLASKCSPLFTLFAVIVCILVLTRKSTTSLAKSGNCC